MSDSSSDRSDRADRPTGVTDPLLWKLASAVAEAHEADDDGACRNPSCAGASWPCAAWRNAQEGLRAAQPAPGTESEAPASDDAGDGDPDRDDPLTGWSTDLLPPASLSQQPMLPAQPGATPRAVVSAA